MKKVILFCLLVAVSLSDLVAQDWQFRYGQSAENERGAYITRTPDGGFLVRAGVSPDGYSALLRLDADGDTLWVNTLGPFGIPADPDDPPVEDRVLVGPTGDIFSVFYDQLLRFDAGGNLLQSVPTDFHRLLGLHADGVLLARGGIDQDTLSLRKYGFDGALLWQKKHTVNGGLYDVQMAPDGKAYALHFSLDGNPLMALSIFSTEGDFWALHDLSPAPWGKIAFDASGNYILYETVLSDPQAPGNSVIMQKYSPDGSVLWERAFETTGKDAVEKIVALPNGSLLLLGTTWGDPVRTPRLYLYSPGGNELWRHEFQPGLDLHFSDAVTTSDGAFVLTGTIGETSGPQAATDAIVWQLEPQGVLEIGLLRGRLVRDMDGDCVAQAAEPGLRAWKVLVNNNPIVTNNLGRFEMEIAPGGAVIQVVKPNGYWDLCPGYDTVAFPGNFNVTNVEIPVSSVLDCPVMEVNVGFARLRRCFSNYGRVTYFNHGTIAEPNARILLVFPPELDFESAEIPIGQINGDSLWFDVGPVEPNSGGGFDIRVKVNCDQVELGQELCTEARIFPDTICTTPANWSGAYLSASATCLGDSLVEFVLRNIGTAPTTPDLNYIIIEDQVVLRSSKLDALPPGAEMRIEQPVDGGSLYRLQADQEPNHPGLSMPAVWVEGCGGGNNPGLGLQYPADDADLFRDIACLPVTGSYDPNDKAAHPEGYDADHYLEPNTDITYRIRFQNTGTDTAFTVTIRDTLSSWLDPLSVRPQTASHPYTWDYTAEGSVLKFTFNDILLPDSFVNEPASNGFVEFRISQKTDVPLGTVIRNDAAIYFDFNPPVITNEVFHTVGREFITVSVDAPLPGMPDLKVFPNPFRDAATFQFDAEVHGRITLFNPQGQAVRQAPVHGPEFVFVRNGLAGGLYFFEVRDTGGRLLARGKVVVQ